MPNVVDLREWDEQPQDNTVVVPEVRFALNSASSAEQARGAGISKIGGLPTVVNELGQCLYSNANGKYVSVTRAGPAYFQDEFVFVYHFRQNGTLINGATMLQLLGTSGSNNKMDIYILNSGVVRVDWYSSGGTVVTCDTAAIVSDKGIYRLELVQRDNTLAWFNDGVATGAAAGLAGVTRNGEAATFNIFGNATTSNNHEVALCAVTRRSPQRLGRNPWQIFEPEEDYINFPSAGGNILLTPAAALSRALGIAPTTILGSMTFTPSSSVGRASAIAPLVRLGSLLIIPVVAAAKALAQVGVIRLGSITLIPALAAAKASALVGSILGGSGVIVAAAAATARALAVAPITILGSIALIPAPAIARAAARLLQVLGGLGGVTSGFFWPQRRRRRKSPK